MNLLISLHDRALILVKELMDLRFTVLEKQVMYFKEKYLCGIR